MTDALEEHLGHDVTLHAAVVTEDERHGFLAYSFARFEAWRTARRRDGTWPGIAERAEAAERECLEDGEEYVAEAERELADARAEGEEPYIIEELEENVSASENYLRMHRAACHPYRGAYDDSLGAIESCGDDRVGLAVFVLEPAGCRLLPERGIEFDTCGAAERLMTLDAADLDADGAAEAVFVVELASYFRSEREMRFPLAESVRLNVVAPDRGLVLQWDGELRAYEDRENLVPTRPDSHRVHWLAGLREGQPALRAEIVHGPGRNVPIRCPCAVFEDADVTPPRWLEDLRWTADHTRSCRSDVDLAALRAEVAQNESGVVASLVCAELVRESATFIYDEGTSQWVREDG